MENNDLYKNLPLIYGITDPPVTYGIQAYAIDMLTGEIIAHHFSSDENFAKSDLGFDGQLLHHWSINNSLDNLSKFGEYNHKKYMEKYPQGYQLVWIGNWKNNKTIQELIKSKAK